MRQWADKGGFAHSPLMEFPPHQRPNVSKLEAFRTEIVAMRSSNWPFLKIATWLHDNHQIQVTKEAARQFCKVRHLGSASPDPTPPPARAVIHPPKRAQTKFEYDDSAPILTRKNGLS